MQRRDFFKSAAAFAVPRAAQYRLATFQSDITPPVGGPLFNNVTARRIVDPLQAHGVVLLGGGQPIVIAALDWCEIRNDSYNLWRDLLAKAARTSRERVLLSCVHQHDAPYVDTEAQRLFEAAKAPGRICNPIFNEHCARQVAAALQTSLRSARRITHFGTGQAKVERVASNRRYRRLDGGVSFGRTSATKDPALRALPEGTIDPWLKTISFWEEDRPVAALSCYSTHPMSYYGKGDVSADFVGMARLRRQKDTPGTAQIYLTGCSGDTIAGKYNDGSPENRPVLADRMYQGMVDAWEATKRRPLENLRFRSIPMHLAPRSTPGFSPAEMRKTLADESKPYLARAEAALGLSWRKRLDVGGAVDVPAIDFGGAHFVLLPAEAFVQYQLWAQELRPDSFVMTAAFGESAPGYIPTAEAAAEGYDDHYSWVAFPECEETMRNALRDALRRGD